MKTIALFGSLIVLLVACSPATEPAPAVKKTESPAPSLETTIAVTTAPIPARYSAPLPKSFPALVTWIEGDPSGPPVSHTVDSILNGDSRWLARLSEAANAVPAAEAAAYAEKWSQLFRFHSATETFCTQVREIISGRPSTARAALALSFAESCSKAEDLPLMVRADTPNSAVLAFYEPWRTNGDERHVPFHPRLIAAAREAILRDPTYEGRTAAFTLAEQNNARADAALVAMQSEIKNRSFADEIALSFLRSKNPDLVARGLTACKRLTDDPACRDAANSSEEANDASTHVSADAVKARVAQLRTAGFTQLDASKVYTPESDSAENILVSAGLAHWFDVETDRYPNEHDSLMRSLALLVAPDLQDAVFEERPPGLHADESHPYEITAYANGKRYRTLAGNYGDWYDVDAVLRLLNKVMEDAKAPSRFTPLDTTDQTLIVVAASPATMANAVKAGLLHVGEDVREAEHQGKAFERDVVEEVLSPGDERIR